MGVHSESSDAAPPTGAVRTVVTLGSCPPSLRKATGQRAEFRELFQGSTFVLEQHNHLLQKCDSAASQARVSKKDIFPTRINLVISIKF